MNLGASRKDAPCLLLVLMICLNFAFVIMPYASASPTWPSSWIVIDWDKNENNAEDDWRDVKYAYYQYDVDYLYLKLQCYDLPGKKWPSRDGRYKWFIDIDGVMYYSGGNIFDAEYLLFVEDTNHDGSGEMYLIFDVNNDDNFDEYEPWPPTNYADYRVADPNVGDWRIVAPDQIEMYINWAFIGAPLSYKLFWSTDQQNPNLDQTPTTDRIDEEQIIIIHNVAAVSQTPTPTIVIQGEHVAIVVLVENKGTQTETFNVTCYYNSTVIGTQLVSNLAAGHQTTVSFDWNTASSPVGNYEITAWADSSAAISETDEGDNWCTSLATVTILPVPIHDVAAVSQVPDKTSVVHGTIVNINVTVINLGDFTETFNITSYYGNNPISHQTVTNLAPQVSTSIIFAWDTTGVASNTYYIRAMADSSRNIIEIDENNNNCTSFEAVTVYSSGDMGKLFVDKVKTSVISGADPAIVGLPTVYELTIIVTNIGGSTISNVNLNETISSDVIFVSVGIPSQGSLMALPPPKIVWNVGTLAPGANATLTFRLSITPPYAGLICLNHKEDVTASGTDTLSNTTVSDVGDVDIMVTAIIRDVAAISQVSSSTVVNQGETVAIYVTVKNLGNVSETFDAACFYDSILIDIMRHHNLAAGGQTTITFEWDTTGIPPGTYSIIAEADSSYEISESNETNNMCTSLSTIEIVLHDVTIISQDPSPTTVTQGEIVTIEVVVKNEGTETETFDVNCYYNETLLEIKTVTDLASNESLTLNFIWDTTGVSAGTYFINTQAIPVAGENDTDNNACLSTTSVTITSQQYYFTVSSPYGTPGGEGWYDNGSTAYATLNAGVIDLGNGIRRIFIFWSGDVSGTNYAQSDSTIMNGSKNAIAHWKTQYYLTIASSSGGVTSPFSSGWHDAGTLVSVTALPDTNYLFEYWELDSINVGSDNPYDLTMETTHTLHATFVYSPPPPVVGGFTYSIKSPLLHTWISLNALLVAAIFIAASWRKRRQGKLIKRLRLLFQSSLRKGI